MQSILNVSLREVLGKVNSADVLSAKRTNLMTQIRDTARAQATALGVKIVDVRIRRADLPKQNLNATFKRMNAEREREARDERARGRERAQELEATADRQAIELVSVAQREAEKERGKADAERNKIFADELMGILQSNDSDIAESVGVIMDIFRYHGICAIRVPPYSKLSSLNWGDNYYNFVKLGPLLVARGRGQTRQEDDDVAFRD